MLTGHVRHDGRLRADRVRASAAGEYTFSIFAVVSIALLASWFVAVLFIPLLGVALLKPPEDAATGRARPGRCASSAGSLSAPCGCGGSRSWRRWPVRRLAPRTSLRAAPVLPVIGPSRAAGRSAACRRMPRSTPAAIGRPGSMPILKGRSRCRALEHLCRTRRDPVLPAAQRRAAQRFLQPVRGRRQGRRRPRAAARQARDACCRTISRAR